MERILHETCQQYVARRLSEGWQIVCQYGHFVLLSSPDGGVLRPVDLRNDTLTLRPNSDETINLNYAEPDGNHWENVDDAGGGDGDSSYVSRATVVSAGWSYDLYGLPDHTAEVGTINSVTVYSRSKRLDTGARTGGRHRTKIFTNAELHTGSTVDPGLSYALTSTVYNDNPQSSSAWTWGEVDALQAGVGCYEDFESIKQTSIVYCTQVYVEVDYTPVVLPTVTTQAASSVEAATATGNGNITNTGGENCDKRGIVYDLASQGAPGNVAPGASGYGDFEEETDSFGTGAFTRSLTGLSTGRTYYARAYAHNSEGYSYGGEVSFLTKPAAPTSVVASDNQSDKVTVTWVKATGATGYQIYRDGTPLGWLGDVATGDDSGAGAPSITPGAAVAGDGGSTAHVALNIAGEGTNNGTTHTYKVKARNATGESVDSATDTGKRIPGALGYQWQRSAGDSDAGYGNIGGATTEAYNDTGAPAPTVTPGTGSASDGSSSAHVTLSLAGESANVGAGRWYKCVLAAAGCAGQTTSANRGYRGVGSLTRQWQRSAADSDADYGNIDGATTDPYNDTGAPGNGQGRYYQCVSSATGATPQTSSSDRGYRWMGEKTAHMAAKMMAGRAI